MTKEIREIRDYFVINIDSTRHRYTKERAYIFEGVYYEYEYTLELFFKANKINDYILRMKGSHKRANDHLEQDGVACVGLKSELSMQKEGIMLSVANWLENFRSIRSGEKEHDHGYRHGNVGVIEKYIQNNFLPFEISSLKKLPENQLKLLFAEVDLPKKITGNEKLKELKKEMRDYENMN